ncbi:glycosyltransferase family 2 protein [Algibacter pectinivorans]|uniref:Glycosyltransferase like family 2 n=1 Tax=Algibacter pectinivorans TaxID=870482 RepID=A0A1I1NZ89_9FLAO|nr:galactosyltransferase-related protein [Algibacter pectinivorans]SFD02642.1 Glycosyltransferase like family 2 [Algibacter pectinivorans]
MITIVLTYRDRDLTIVKKCLDALGRQSSSGFNVVLVDYGSQIDFAEALSVLVKKYSFIKIIQCPVNGQLWNKSRAINIALKLCNTPYFLVGDIDLVFHPDFIKIASKLASENVTYFKYSFLSKEESLKDKNFEDYEIDFEGGKEITGTTLFPTETLKKVNGYDEFYHGWGAEDTDIHQRLKTFGLHVSFYDSNILVKHQWHPKAYRSKTSSSPFHSVLERVNHHYMNLTINNKVIKANKNQNWGMLPNKEDYLKLSLKPDVEINIQPIDFHFSALLAQFKNFKNKVVKIQINKVNFKQKVFQSAKKALNKRYFNYLKLEDLNNLLLEEIIKNYRNCPYVYHFNREAGSINLIIYFN